MVHALNEVRRVLAKDGLLIDRRPMLDRWPVEISSLHSVQEAGRATDLREPIADDQAANDAMQESLQRGWLVRERQETFSFFYYWDTPNEMQEYINDEWDDIIKIEDELWNVLRSSWTVANADARVRLRMKMLITRYQKPD
jgi:hypothetical protein